MNVCVTVNSKYMRYTYIMLQSLYENNKKGSIDLYVIHRDFTEKDQNYIREITEQFGNRVCFIWMNPDCFEKMPLDLIEGTTLSLEIFFRLLIPETLRTLDKVLMLDVDIVINGSIQELYDMDIEHVCLAAAPNLCTKQQVPLNYRSWYPSTRTHWIHFNTGVLLWNLKYIREKYPEKYIFNQALSWKIRTMAFEEELFNVLFGEKDILSLDPFKWNYITTYEDILRGKFQYHMCETVEELRNNHTIIHFLARNPWGEGAKNESYRLWWEYAEKTPFYHELCREQIEKVELNQPEKLPIEYKASVLESLLRMKGTGELKEKIVKRNVNHIYLYGAGIMAELFYLTLCAEQMQDYVRGVFDKVKQGKFENWTIRKPDVTVLKELGKQFGNEHCVIIITPSYEIEKIKNELCQIVPQNVEIISLQEIIH